MREKICRAHLQNDFLGSFERRREKFTLQEMLGCPVILRHHQIPFRIVGLASDPTTTTNPIRVRIRKMSLNPIRIRIRKKVANPIRIRNRLGLIRVGFGLSDPTPSSNMKLVDETPPALSPDRPLTLSHTTPTASTV